MFDGSNIVLVTTIGALVISIRVLDSIEVAKGSTEEFAVGPLVAIVELGDTVSLAHVTPASSL